MFPEFKKYSLYDESQTSITSTNTIMDERDYKALNESRGKEQISKPKKMLMAAPYFLLWIFYVCLTMEKRTEYLMSLEKGYKCTGSKDVSWLIPGSTTRYYFDPTKKPERDYLTWKQFWKVRGY